jgi:hypothetical protein
MLTPILAINFAKHEIETAYNRDDIAHLVGFRGAALHRHRECESVDTGSNDSNLHGWFPAFILRNCAQSGKDFFTNSTARICHQSTGKVRLVLPFAVTIAVNYSAVRA